MTSPIEMVLARLDGYNVSGNGRDRWRSRCPAHDGSNSSTLSIGIGVNDAVLLKCWAGCETSEVAAALGIEIHDLFQSKNVGNRPVRRRHLLTAGQALELLGMEAMIVRLCATDMARGEELDDITRERLMISAARILMMRSEVNA